MSKRFRWFIFLLSVTLFFILSYLTVVFALGYKFDYEKRLFVRMGSFRVAADNGADVYINNNLSGNLSFINHDFSKSRLIPRVYSVRLEKNGFYTWSKNIQVTAGLFSDYPRIILIKSSNEMESVASVSMGFATVENFERKADGRELNFDAKTVTIKWTENTDYQPYRKSGDREAINIFGKPIYDVQWHRDSNHIFVSSGGKLYLTEIDTRGGINSFPITDLDGSFWYDQNNNSVYFAKNGVMYRIKL